MKSLKTLLVTLAAAGVVALSVSAQQPTTPNQQQNQAMDMQGMMQGCQKNMQGMMQSNDQAQKEIEAAKQSNDIAKMRAALDTAEKALSKMNDHMKNCQNMMNMMQHMQGMMSGQQGQKNPAIPPKQ